MARLAATAVLLLSLLAVASCRVLEAEPEAAVAISDVHEMASDAATMAEGILRLPSHRRPCRHGFLHRHLRWARHHGLSHRRDAFPDTRVHPAVVLPEEPRKAELEAVAEPDPDRRPDTEGERLIPFHGEEEEEEENESVKAWKGEMLRRFRGHGLRFHHHHHEHAEEKDASDDKEQQDKEEGAGAMQVKMFSRHFHHHNHGDEEQEETARKHHDGDNKVDEVEELARRLSKAIMRRSLGRGGIRHHHHAEEGGVRNWFRGLLNMNRF